MIGRKDINRFAGNHRCLLFSQGNILRGNFFQSPRLPIGLVSESRCVFASAWYSSLPARMLKNRIANQFVLHETVSAFPVRNFLAERLWRPAVRRTRWVQPLGFRVYPIVPVISSHPRMIAADNTVRASTVPLALSHHQAAGPPVRSLTEGKWRDDVCLERAM